MTIKNSVLAESACREQIRISKFEARNKHEIRIYKKRKKGLLKILSLAFEFWSLGFVSNFACPAVAAARRRKSKRHYEDWIPASAGMTRKASSDFLRNLQ